MTAASDKMRFWCDMTLECVRRDHTNNHSTGDQRGPFFTARAMGMALGALNDAQALALGGTGLLGLAAPAALLGLGGGSAAALAGAAACAQVLRLRYPNQSQLLEPAWLNWLDYFGQGAPGSPAEVAGRAFGTRVHQLGAADSVHGAVDQYAPSGAPYTHIAPPNDMGQRYSGAKWGGAVPLIVGLIPNFPPPPGRVSSFQVLPTQHFKDDFAKVVTKGDINRTPGAVGARSLEEEVIGIAWGYDGPQELGTPPRLYMQVVLTVLDRFEASNPGALSAQEELALIAGVAIAMSDASISAWHYKYSPAHMMWRPGVGVQNASPGNGDADPGWIPLGRPDTNGTAVGRTPDFPAYPSGHATFGAAAFQLLRLVLVEKGLATFDPNGVDDVAFEFVSDEYDGRNKDPRTMRPRDLITLGLPSLWQATVDNSVSRVYLGVHWQFDGITTRNAANTDDDFGVPAAPIKLGRTGGVWLGAQIANQIASKLGVSASTLAASKMV